jgi:nucleoside-diphosphate-sugar epimerase
MRRRRRRHRGEGDPPPGAADRVISSPAVSILVTGAFGCIGAWVVRGLLAEGERPVAYDLADDPWRLRMIVGPEVERRILIERGDIADRDRLTEVVRRHRISRMIHLAAWQVPLCRQDPARGALVNVVGTANVFAAARAAQGQVERVVYASSAAVFGPPALYPPGPIQDDAPPRPATHYGVYKVANEETARIDWDEHRLPSMGFRPLSVYGPGRDFGVTADPTLAMKAAVLGRTFQIRYGGRTDLIFVEDVARALLAAARSQLDGARVYNLHGTSVAIADVVRLITEIRPEARGLISHAEPAMPFVDALDDARYQRDLGPAPATPLEVGVRRTLDEFARLQKEGRLDARELG